MLNLTECRDRIDSVDNQILELSIECSKGTYIRTIVNDIGQELNCGAVMFKLIRTKSAGMNLADSFTLTDKTTPKEIENHLIDPLSVLKINTYEINEYEYNKLLNGNQFKNRKNLKDTILLTKNNKVVAIATGNDKIIQPRKVLI